MGVTEFVDLPGNQIPFVILHFHGVDVILKRQKHGVIKSFNAECVERATSCF